MDPGCFITLPTTNETPATNERETRSQPIVLPTRLTHPDRVLFADQGITKRALAEYYVTVADRMLPHVENRLLTLVRCPEGQGKDCFYQKHVSKGVPEALRTVSVHEKDKLAEYVVVDDVAGLVSLVQMGVLEIHAWGSHADAPDQPDQLVFDLDPAPGVDWGSIVEGALTIREQLRDLGLEGFVKTSGGKGLHVVVPVRPRAGWEETKAFCRGLAERICRREPQKYVCNMSKAKREGRIFIDYLRNSRGATSVCAYSTRARPGAPVSTPVAWEELAGELRADSYTFENVPTRLAALAVDPWACYGEVQQSITRTAAERIISR